MIFNKNKEWLYNKYIKEGMSPTKISKTCGETYGTIRYWLKKYGIPTRSISESLVGRRFSEETKKKLSESHKEQVTWMKGKHHTEESKEKNRNAHIGRKHTEETKQKMSGKIPWSKGLKMSEEFCLKISEAKKGNKNRVGKPFTQESRNKISESLLGNIPWNKGGKCPQTSGINNGNWKGGLTKLNYNLRVQSEYILWRKSIFIRDNFTCQTCKQSGGKLVAHHINNFADFPELRLAIDNGVTLCKGCHKRFHKEFGKRNNTKEQIEIFLLGDS